MDFTESERDNHGILVAPVCTLLFFSFFMAIEVFLKKSTLKIYHGILFGVGSYALLFYGTVTFMNLFKHGFTTKS